MVTWWERVAYLLVITVGAIVCILYTNYEVGKTCPIYSILDRPVAKTDTPDTKKIREAIHRVRVNYNCPPPLIKPTTTTTSTVQ